MKVVYKKINGIASDVRLLPDGYALGANELEIAGVGSKPDVETLHDPVKKKQRDDKLKQILTLEDVISVLSKQQRDALDTIKASK